MHKSNKVHKSTQSVTKSKIKVKKGKIRENGKVSIVNNKSKSPRKNKITNIIKKNKKKKLTKAEINEASKIEEMEEVWKEMKSGNVEEYDLKNAVNSIDLNLNDMPVIFVANVNKLLIGMKKNEEYSIDESSCTIHIKDIPHFEKIIHNYMLNLFLSRAEFILRSRLIRGSINHDIRNLVIGQCHSNPVDSYLSNQNPVNVYTKLIKYNINGVKKKSIYKYYKFIHDGKDHTLPKLLTKDWHTLVIQDILGESETMSYCRYKEVTFKCDIRTYMWYADLEYESKVDALQDGKFVTTC